jgi:hypothetical protein
MPGAKRSAPRGPRQQPLIPGVRHHRLDSLCESIADTRGEMNKLDKEDAEDCAAALKYCREHKVGAYKHAGIELAYVQGGDKLRVRTVKDKAAELLPPGDENLAPANDSKRAAANDIVDAGD